MVYGIRKVVNQAETILVSTLIAISWLNPITPAPIVSGVSWLLTLVALGALVLRSERGNDVALMSAGLIKACMWSALISANTGLVQFVSAPGVPPLWLASSSTGEVYANLRQRNQLASLLVMGLLILVLLPGRVDSQRWVRQALKSLGLGLMTLCLAATGSRTGALQMVCMVLALVLMWHRLQEGVLRWAFVVLLMYGASVLLMPWLAQWVGNSQTGLLGRVDDANAFSRLAMWSNVLELIAQTPWAGHGWGGLAYAHYSGEFSGARFMELLDNAHNLPLHLAVELGLPVALGFCALVVWAIVRSKPWRETQPERLMAWGCLMVIGIHSMLEYPLWYGPFFLTAVLCIGILCADLWRNGLLALTESARNAIVLGVRGLGCALLAFTAFVAFDYHRVSQIYLQPEERSSWYADDALGAAQKSVLFKSHAKFAELVITPLSRETAPRVLELSSELVMWSPEPRVIEALIESSVMLGVDDLAAFHLKRYRVAYPQAYADWKARTGQLPS